MASTTNTLLQKLVNGKSLQKVLDSDAESFAEVPLTKYLQELCEERDVVPEQVIKKAQIDRTYGHQIFNGTRNPSRDKLIQLAVGFGLSLDETQMLLKKAGKSVLYSKIKRDAGCIYGISHGMNMMELQELLLSVDVPLLGRF